MKKIILGAIAALTLVFAAGTAAQADYSRGSSYQSGSAVKLPYYAKTAKPASGVSAGLIVLSTGTDRSDCGHGTIGAASTYVVCVSNGTNWIAL